MTSPSSDAMLAIGPLLSRSRSQSSPPNTSPFLWFPNIFFILHFFKIFNQRIVDTLTNRLSLDFTQSFYVSCRHPINQFCLMDTAQKKKERKKEKVNARKGRVSSILRDTFSDTCHLQNEGEGRIEKQNLSSLDRNRP